MSSLKKSPTINQIKDKMKEIKDKINNTNEPNKISTYTIFFIILYSVFSLLYLIYFKPSVCCKHQKDENNKDIYKLSYTKLLLVYIIILLPIIFYLLLRFL